MMKRFNAADTPLEGTNLIEASAGTGKTFTISMIYLRLLVENKMRIDQILVVTFTVPATMELRLRIRSVISDALRYCETGVVKEKIIAEIMDKHSDDPSVVQRLRGALKSFDEASVYTIHSFCQQVLADNAFESGSLFSSDITTDDVIHERLAADFWRMNVYNLPEYLAEYIINHESPASLVSLYRRRPLSPQMRIEPQVNAPSVKDIERFVKNIEQLYLALSIEWSKSDAEIEKILLNDPAINKRKYVKKTMLKRLGAMDEYISAGYFYELAEGFEYFTISKICTSLNNGYSAPEHNFFNIAELMCKAMDIFMNALRDYLVKFRTDMFSYIDTEGRRIKGGLGKRGFDDLIRDVQSALRSERGILLARSVRVRYKAALIDEFQDTDDLQYDIFNGIFGTGESTLFLIGDPKQAIYRFRGADIFSYIKASKTVMNRYTLANNYRSTPELISSVNSIFSAGSSPFVFSDIMFNAVEAGKPDQCDYLYKGDTRLPSMDISLADYFAVKNGEEKNDEILLTNIAAEISELTAGGGYKFMPSGEEVKPSDIAVLVRSHHQASAVQEALARCGIPSVTRGHESVLSTSEAGEICRIIAAVAEPGRSARLRSAAATSIIGYNASDIFRLNDDSGDGGALHQELTERFHGYRDVWIKTGFMDMFTLLLFNENITVRILGRSRGERAMANINHLAEILNMVQFENSYSPDELVSWMENAIADPPQDDAYVMRLDKDSDAVEIVTMHACKGLEYPVVFCPYLAHQSKTNKKEAFVYHDPGDDYAPVMCLDNDRITPEIKEISEREDLAENVRLMYVALTRAKSMCRVLFTVKNYFLSTAPAHVLLEGAFEEKPSIEDSFNIFASVLKKLSSESGGEISFRIVRGEDPELSGKPESAGEALQQRLFTGEISKTWGMQSYSSITKTRHDEKSDGFAGKSAETGIGIFAFPRGTKAGLCLHEIFELTDFREKDKAAVSGTVLSLLRKYGYEESWCDDVAGMFFNVTAAELPASGGVRLEDIDMNSRLSEMEFNFPLGEFSMTGFRGIFSTAKSYGRTIYDRLGDDETAVRGMMKGFIDLVFRAGDKYYIADWKSNSLGTCCGDYNDLRMDEEMLRHNYHLQYYLYSVALHRYLSLRMGDAYSYSRNFGGVYYFFVRGMTAGAQSPGIFHTVPDEDTVRKLDKFFRGETAQ